MKKIFSSITGGFLRGLPLLNTVKKLVVKPATAQTPVSPDLIAIITEVATVALIVFYVFKKISNEDLVSLLKLLKG